MIWGVCVCDQMAIGRGVFGVLWLEFSGRGGVVGGVQEYCLGEE